MGDIRKGTVSGVDYQNGMVRVTYSDKGKSVTKSLPYMNCNGEYKMPEVGDSVVVGHLSNGSSRGIVIGTYWNKKNRPPECGKGIYKKEMSTSPGKAYQRYSDASGAYEMVSKDIQMQAENEIKQSAKSMSADIQDALEIISKMVKLQIEEELNIAVKKITAEIEENLKIVAKTANINGKEGLKMYSDNNTELKADAQMNLEDANWKTTLSRIMERLQALDGNLSDRK